MASIMYGESSRLGLTRYSSARSRRTVGANGIQKSRFLIIRLMSGTTRWSVGLARMERLPSARAPNSMRPAQRATTPSETSSSAIRSSIRS